MSATSQLALAGGRTSGLESLPGYRAAVAGFLLLALLLFGGASSSDEYAQVPVRLAAVACIAASFWPLEFTVLRPDRWLIAFALACLALPALQLVPLPVARWAALPGHRLYAEVAAAAGSSAWRPLSLTPDLTINALQALLPPFAMLLAALYLDPRDRKAIAALLVTAGIVSAVLALAQLASPGDTLRLYRHTTEGAPVGLFANRNHEAALLACTLPFGAATIARRPKRLGAPLMLGALGACALLTSVVIVLTGSRMGLASVGNRDRGNAMDSSWTQFASASRRERAPADRDSRHPIPHFRRGCPHQPGRSRAQAARRRLCGRHARRRAAFTHGDGARFFPRRCGTWVIR